MGKKSPMHCQGKKQESTEKLGKVLKPQQRTSLIGFVENYTLTLEYFKDFKQNC